MGGGRVGVESIGRQRSTNAVVVGMGGGRVEWKALKGREALIVVVVGWEGVGWSGKH